MKTFVWIYEILLVAFLVYAIRKDWGQWLLDGAANPDTKARTAVISFAVLQACVLGLVGFAYLLIVGVW